MTKRTYLTHRCALLMEGLVYKTKSFTPLLALAGLALSCASANAAAVIYEPFSQDTSSTIILNGKAGGTGLSGNWSSTTGGSAVNVVNPPTLDYGNLDNSGGQANLANSGSTWASITTTTGLANAGLLNDGATLWFSYVFQKTANGGSNEQSGFAFGTDRVNPAFNGLNMQNSGSGLGVFTNGSAVGASSWSGGARTGGAGGNNTFTLSEPTLVIGRIVWGATVTDNEVITIWTRALDDIDTAPSTGGSIRTSGPLDQSAFGTLSFGQRNSTGVHTYDEIRFGASFADVSPIPEPSAALLGSLGGLLLLRRRRG